MFSDRRDAGRRLAGRLLPLRREDPVIVSLPYGALEVADEIADRLQAPLRLLLVRRLKAPGTRALMGAVSEHRSVSIDVRAEVAPQDFDEQIALETVELYRRSSVLRRWAPPVVVVRRTVVVVDDGSSPLAVIQAALVAVRAERPGKIIYATPVADAGLEQRIRNQVDDVHVLERVPAPLFAADHYESFPVVGDESVGEILRERGM